ncbi:type IIS restriction endonuclease [Candidatus Magnetomorum sp. HK-1]|nr:type IIS restriction endonuclease [Candidatus Magnetomorum sp. HK-1]
MNLGYFESKNNFYKGLQTLFNSLNIPVNYIDENPLKPQDILSGTYKDSKPAYQLMRDVYILGMVDDNAFSHTKSENVFEIKKDGKDYEGILIFGVLLKKRENDFLPTRSQLAEITRAFNRKFHYTPVTVVFRYEHFISLANIERRKYKQEWREGEKTGKVSILRDINIANPHTGHIKILESLKINRSGKKGINNFKGLYQYWQEVFSVNLLNKKFYIELSNWYFWAIKHVTFPSEPTNQSVFAATKSVDIKKLEAVKQEFKAKNVIRLLTRLLFVWFIKEKELIPEDLFDLETLQKNILKKISPFNEEATLYKEVSRESIYYKAILQNLFFATLNCPVKPDCVDSRERGFRGDESYGKHRGVDYLMRYKKYFKDPDAFLKMVNKVVPFLNGGLFECLDDKDRNIYIDGFSDNMSKAAGVSNTLVVPDYLFFGREEKTDLSADYGIKDKGAKEAAVKGLINILKSYKFTIAENTPIEEDVALDPELLGKVFENLLASYNPETKTTARKQTGSFYTPREIVNYMVDESLIAHLKNAVSNWDMEEKELDAKLHQLLSYDPDNPFENNTSLSAKIINSLDNCKILDPACGSGAFPMGILQKMVHILQKIDPNNEYWQELQKEKVQKETQGVFSIKDKEERKQLLIEINEAFDETVNNPDYARKLFLIENCIYGVDIQPIATQISKLRFFISLVVEQKVNKDKDNFGIRPLPNLETRFVTANTLIGIDKPEGELFYTQAVQEKEAELKAIRHKLFGAKTKETKVKYRIKDEVLRHEIADILKKSHLPVNTAEQLAAWDPYDQNGVSPFFDPEWMFDIKDGFDVVIGNPPYIQIQKFSGQQCQKDWEKQNYKTFVKTGDIYSLFYERGNMVLRHGGVLAYITSNKWMRANYGKKTRQYFLENTNILQLIDFGDSPIFENATTYTNILIFANRQAVNSIKSWDLSKEYKSNKTLEQMLNENDSCETLFNEDSFVIIPTEQAAIKKRIEEIGTPLKEWDVSINFGIKTGYNKAFIIDSEKKDELIAKDPKSAEIIKPILRERDIKRYKAEFADLWLIATFPTLNLKIENYPAIKKYLESFVKRIEQTGEAGSRKKTNNKWFETQDQIGNYQEFEIEKIIYSEIVYDSAFYYDKQKIYPDATVFTMTGESLKYLTALLNSNLITYVFKSFYAGGDLRGNTFRYKKVFLANLPVPKIPVIKQLPFEILVDCILFAKEKNMNIEANTFESVIDGMVYDLYFEAEMKKANCYITERISEVVRPFKEDDSDAFKREYIEKLHTFCQNDKTVFRGLIHRRNVSVVKIISGEKK